MHAKGVITVDVLIQRRRAGHVLGSNRQKTGGSATSTTGDDALGNHLVELGRYRRGEGPRQPRSWPAEKSPWSGVGLLRGDQRRVGKLGGRCVDLRTLRALGIERV